MRDLVFAAVVLGLLPLAVARPIVGVVLWCWLSFMNPHRLVWGFASEMPWAQVVFVATVLGCLLNAEPRRLAMNGVTALLMLFMACVTLTSFTALGPSDAVWDYWQRVLKIVIGLLLVASLITDRMRLHILMWVMVISIGFYGVRGGVFTIMTGGAFQVLGPADSMISDRNHIGVALLVVLPLMNYLRLHSRHRLVRWGLMAAMGLTLLGAIGTQSRGALLALLAVAVVLWLRTQRKVLGGIVIAASVAGGIAFMPDTWTERMQTIQTFEQDQSAFDRLVLWQTAFNLAVARPFVGTGFRGPYHRSVVDQFDPDAPARATHSIYFETLGEHGFVTFAVWLSLTFAGLYYAMRLPRITRGRPDLAWAGDLGRMAQVSIVAYLVGGAFLSLGYWDFYWTLLAAVGVAHTLAVRALAQGAGATGRAPAAATWRSAGAVAQPEPVAQPAQGWARAGRARP
jgi:probable O-glycosylation ligase (exosortase A-associated)